MSNLRQKLMNIFLTPGWYLYQKLFIWRMRYLKMHGPIFQDDWAVLPFGFSAIIWLFILVVLFAVGRVIF